MFSFLGYNFMFDKDALNSTPNNVLDISEVTLRHGIIDHFNVSRDVISDWTGIIPTEWTNDTIMNADFNGHINAGNIGYVLGQITGVRVKRRRVDDVSETWITLYEIYVEKAEDLSFTVIDHFNQDQVEYVYGLFPIIIQGDTEVEGVPTESDPVLSEMDGVYIVDSNNFYRLYANVNYDNLELNQEVGVHPTLGSQYPITVSNSKTGYETGGFSATIVNPEIYEIGGKLDRHKMVGERNKLSEFLINHKPKVLKDWNGNMWLIFITDNPSITFAQNYGMGLADINAKWVEIGDANNESNLRKAGLIGGGI